jgi:hypothetical protein
MDKGGVQCQSELEAAGGYIIREEVKKALKSTQIVLN